MSTEYKSKFLIWAIINNEDIITRNEIKNAFVTKNDNKDNKSLNYDYGCGFIRNRKPHVFLKKFLWKHNSDKFCLTLIWRREGGE